MKREKTNSSRKWRRSELRQRRCFPDKKHTEIPRPLSRNLSPLELFRMTLEVEPSDDSPLEDSPSSPGEDDAKLNCEFDRQSRCHADDDSCRSQSTSYDNGHTSPAEFQSTNASFENRSTTKANSKFPFKQCSKMMTSARRTLRLVDMSIITKERFFKNPHYLTNCTSCSSSLTRTPRRDGSINFNPFDKRASTASGGNKFKLEDSKRRSSSNGLLKKLKMLTTESSNAASSHVTSPVLEDSATETSASNGSVGHNGGGSMSKLWTQKRRSQDGRMSTTSHQKVHKNTQQSRRASEDRGVHSQQGFTAFVPFQGFAAFANQRDRSDRTTPLSARA